MRDFKRPAAPMQLSLLDYDSETAIIMLASGQVTYVDAIDEDWINQEKWHARKSPLKSRRVYYAARCQWVKGVLKTFLIHREIMERVAGRKLERNEFIDHIDSDTLNNRRSNLRIATPSQNSQNMKLSIKNTSGYKGVSKWTYGPKWRAQIKVDNKIVYLGTFDTPEEAHEAYKIAAVKYFGEFARFE